MQFAKGQEDAAAEIVSLNEYLVYLTYLEKIDWEATLQEGARVFSGEYRSASFEVVSRHSSNLPERSEAFENVGFDHWILIYQTDWKRASSPLAVPVIQMQPSLLRLIENEVSGFQLEPLEDDDLAAVKQLNSMMRGDLPNDLTPLTEGIVRERR